MSKPTTAQMKLDKRAGWNNRGATRRAPQDRTSDSDCIGIPAGIHTRADCFGRALDRYIPSRCHDDPCRVGGHKILQHNQGCSAEANEYRGSRQESMMMARSSDVRENREGRASLRWKELPARKIIRDPHRYRSQSMAHWGTWGKKTCDRRDFRNLDNSR